MSSDYVGKKLVELKVCDLRVELEKRGLETTGIKIALVERLQKALVKDGYNADEYIFDGKIKDETICQERDSESNCDSNSDTQHVKTEPNCDEDTKTSVDVLKTENPCDKTIETFDNQITIGCDNDNDAEHLELTVIDSDKLDTSNVDNEDSLNLTIGEEEAKIFQDEEPDEKIKESNIEEKGNGSDSAESSSSLASSGQNGGNAATNNSSKNKAASRKDTSALDDNKMNEMERKADAIRDNAENVVTTGDGSGSRNEDESESKTSSAKASKDGKETSSKANNNLSSSTTAKVSSASASRNLWVSGLSSLTRATDLKIIFSKYGKVIGAKVVTNTRTPGTRCFGYVTMSSSNDATKCITHLHRTELHGRIISVERAKSDIGNIGNKHKRGTQNSVDTKPATDEKRTNPAASDRPRKTRTDEVQGKYSSTTAAAITSITTSSSSSKETPADGTDLIKKLGTISALAKDDTTATSDIGASTKSSNSVSRSDGERNNVKRSNQSERTRRPTESERLARRERKRDRDRVAVLSYRKIKEERERARMRERERKLREEERHRAAERRRQRDEEERLQKERNKLREERLRLEREKADLLRLERERQKLEREKIELERLELKRQQLKIEEARRAMKRPSSDHARYNDIDRKRSSNDRRFDPPPPPKISIYPSSTSKRTDDYKPSSRGSNTSMGNISNECRATSDISSSFKRPMNDGYSKRSSDIEPQPRSASGYDQRASVSQIGASGKEHRFNDADNRSGGTFARNRGDDRDARGSVQSRKSRYMDSHSNGNSNERSYERQQSTSSPAWNNGPQSSVKSFNVPNDPWAAMGKIQPSQESNNWGRIDNQNQERYDRTYNERNAKYIDSNVNASNSGNRPSSFINNSRTQDRYNNMANRFDGGRF